MRTKDYVGARIKIMWEEQLVDPLIHSISFQTLSQVFRWHSKIRPLDGMTGQFE